MWLYFNASYEPHIEGKHSKHVEKELQLTFFHVEGLVSFSLCLGLFPGLNPAACSSHSALQIG